MTQDPNIPEINSNLLYQLANKIIDNWPGICAGIVSMAVAVGGCIHNQQRSDQHAVEIKQNKEAINTVENKADNIEEKVKGVEEKADIAKDKAAIVEKKVKEIEKKDK